MQNTNTPPTEDAEQSAMMASLDAARGHAAGTIEGLSVEQLDASTVPSGWTPRGQLEHLLVNERFWVRAIIGGDPGLIAELEAEPDDTWRFDPTLGSAELAALYLDECAAANRVLAAVSPDAEVAWFPAEQFGGWRVDLVREVTHHLLLEVATHAGHLDIARELVDGKQWMVFD